MFNHLTKPFLALFLLGLFTPVSQVFSAGGLDMSFDSNIAEYLNKIIATREQNSYLERSYEANFPADPFGAVVEEIQNQKNELIIGGISEIATQLQMKGCSLTQKKISNILYYFEDNFRANMGAQVAKKSNQYIDARPTGGEAEKACVEFNQCYYGNGNFKGDVMTDCKDKFQTWYREGSIRKERFQTVKIAQVGQDKYWNNSLEDSPFDLLYDMSAISKILFESVQEPYQLAFYHLPNRKGSGKS
ncbi:hypothetical protein FACS1894176_04800 [Bacteroidia bacterium]|nr:hypothetical protein FACS1894176_04800 [Bacteroidia bacterium]